MYYRLVSTPAGFGALAGVGMGIAAGARFWLVERSLIAALLGVVVGGIFFGAVFGFGSRQFLEPMHGMAGEDRATVMRTVQKGLPTTDRRLAPAVVVYADTLRQQNERIDALLRSAGFRVLLVFPVILGIVAAVDRAWAWLAFHIAVVLGAALGPALLRPRRERFERAERSAQALLGSP